MYQICFGNFTFWQIIIYILVQINYVPSVIRTANYKQQYRQMLYKWAFAKPVLRGSRCLQVSHFRTQEQSKKCGPFQRRLRAGLTTISYKVIIEHNCKTLHSRARHLFNLIRFIFVLLESYPTATLVCCP